MIGLEPLLTALREAGLPVGIAEMARLQRVFALSPEPGGPRLQSVLRAVLVKSAEDRAVFERVFETWLGQADHEVRLREAPESAITEGLLRAPQSLHRWPFWKVLAPVALLLLSLSLSGHFVVRPREAFQIAEPDSGHFEVRPREFVGELFEEGRRLWRPIKTTTCEPPSPLLPSTPFNLISVARTPADIRKRLFTTWVPTLTVSSAELIWQSWLPLGLGIAALAAAGGLWLALRRRRWFPEPAPEPVRKGPPRVFLSPPTPAGRQLLLPREEEALVWGIGHFVAEEPTRRLDFPGTVRATAQAAGLPHLRFHLARHPREVWLWIDEAADDPAIQRLVEEVTATLEVHGLPVERALFRGVPDWLVNTAGQAFAPNEVDERRDAALVAIFTDGRVLARHYAADDRRVGLDALLRSLSHWPRLAFVDFSFEPGELGAILAPHFIERILPKELAGFLGADETLRRRAAAAGDDLAVWAAACALTPSSVDELQAFELRRYLGLAASPWSLRALRDEAPGPPGRLHWKAQDRARRINWLRKAEAQPLGGLDTSTFLGQALAFWQELYNLELKKRTEGETGTLWQTIPAHQHLRMERALLALWRDSDVPEVVRELYSLHGGTLRETIKEQLGQLAPLDWGGEELIHLPWTWASRSGIEQVMLQEMGLAGGMPMATLRRPGRVWIGVAICLGLAAGAFGVTVLSSSKTPVLVHAPWKPAVAFEGLVRLPAGSWGVTVATRKTMAAEEVMQDARVAVRWEEKELSCVAPLDGGKAQVWSCGTVATPPRFTEAIGRRIFALVTEPETPDAEALAIDLLDSGSADAVVLSPDWRKSTRLLTGFYPTGQELLVLPKSAWRKLSHAIRFEGTKPLHDVWPGLSLLSGDSSALLRGLNSCRNGETLEEKGMAFVHICPGTFNMGSDESEHETDLDEKPAHEVTLGEYWIGQSEVTERQYGKDRTSTLPATDVSWFEAKDFCQRHGWRLPTEAEWEYAARSGTDTPWFFGNDERALRDFAWFEGSSVFERCPVGTRYPNPWGIHDMHGNVWEWVEDWYGPYEVGPQRDPTGPSAGRTHVLRGGAFFDPPWYLRSTSRFGSEPGNLDPHPGFRCARGPRRQP